MEGSWRAFFFLEGAGLLEAGSDEGWHWRCPFWFSTHLPLGSGETRLFQPDSDASGNAQCKLASRSVSSLLMHSLCWKNNLVNGYWAPVRAAQDSHDLGTSSSATHCDHTLVSPLLSFAYVDLHLSVALRLFSEHSYHPPPVKWNTVP